MSGMSFIGDSARVTRGVTRSRASSARRAPKGLVVVAAARPVVVVVSDTAAASAWLPSAGSENPTMTWRVTPSPASIATRAGGARYYPGPRIIAVEALPSVAGPVSERSARAGLLPFPTCRAAALRHHAAAAYRRAWP